MRVVVAEPEQLQRDVLKELLHRRDLEVVGEATNGLDAVTSVETLRPDLLITEMTLTTLDGADVTERLRRGDNDARIVVLTAETAAGPVARALRAGADAYVTKRRFSELIAAVETVKRGGRYLSEDLRARFGSVEHAAQAGSAISVRANENAAGSAEG